MKNILLFLALLTFLTAGAFAQESRQDVSISGTGVFPPYVTGNAVIQTPSKTIGGLASYRFMLTPHSALEGNFSYWQNSQHFVSPANDFRVHARNYEASAAYVYSFNFRNLNPFIEGGPAAIISVPNLDRGTQMLGAQKDISIGGLFGGGIAYEISPSFDIRAEYRGIVGKAPNYKFSNFSTGRYGITQMPAIGIAYHF